VNRSFEDEWREISPYLDAVLDLEPEARQAWLDDFKTREPAIAVCVRAYLLELEQLQKGKFLETPFVSTLRTAIHRNDARSPDTSEIKSSSERDEVRAACIALCKLMSKIDSDR